MKTRDLIRLLESIKDIRRYMKQFNESNIAPVDFFMERTYIDKKGRSAPLL